MLKKKLIKFNKNNEYIKIIIVLLSIFLLTVFSIQLIKQYLITEMYNNPNSNLDDNKLIKLLFSERYNSNSASSGSHIIKIKYLRGLNPYFKPINLMDGANTNWDINIIHVFSSWCILCKNEIPTILKIHDILNIGQLNSRIIMTAIIYNDNYADAMRMLKSHPKLYDNIGYLNEDEAIELGIYGIPSTIVINADGFIIYKNSKSLTNKDVDELKKISQSIKNIK